MDQHAFGARARTEFAVALDRLRAIAGAEREREESRGDVPVRAGEPALGAAERAYQSIRPVADCANSVHLPHNSPAWSPFSRASGACLMAADGHAKTPSSAAKPTLPAGFDRNDHRP